MTPEYQGQSYGIYNADCIEVLAGLPDGLIDCAIFSPPFADLFVYSDSERDMGNCGSYDEFFEHYRFFAENLFRVMKPGRITCVHCTDLPARKGKDGFIGLHDFSGDLIRAHRDAGFVYHARAVIWKDPVVEMQRTKALGLLYKQLKKDSAMSRVGMPDYMLFFRKDEPNLDPITHDPEDLPVDMWQELASPVWMTVRQGNVLNGRLAKGQEDERHICPLQLDVIERCLKLYSNPGDLILDPFNGIGSTGFQAVKMQRRYIGIELKPEYARQAARFLVGAEAERDTLFSAA
ncbi:DNA-methyltransferase [Paenirhodobacter populi]|uniref:Methyltransferase n=1 Tax=Paenirhodobacter populi TaxID=2306993 RepID=A0A443J732_9RHOB|nr:site-specific DNA-methyltransferase [Sinirhodobacter populi]RWR16411.1 site-specific DNA-methyltransferase [Sinirhodobacter populi]